jgi:ribonuclease G
LEREIIVEVYPWESRVAVVENGRLVEIFWADQNDNVGNIYKGRVKDIIPGLSCAFIDIGLAKNAFLYKGDIVVPGLKRGSNIFDLLKSGQDIMVQVKKEAFADKGARVTGNMTIPGHYLVLLPFQSEVSISRKITNNDRREYLRTIIELDKPDNMGIIVRTACREAKDEEIISELKELVQVWADINARYEKARTPSLIYEDIDTLERTLREYLDVEISRIVINNRKLQERISLYVEKKNASCRKIICINAPCPMAAKACFSGRVLGTFFMPMRLAPTRMAPEVTRRTSSSRLCKSAISRTSLSMRCRFN